ncbi:SpnB-like Rossmann fold domain-containing protein, partial [Pseudofrankia asymbiotica]|uniref:SpnB-like Rossmann fold domain-containing protein n=1 Tax=Pseudofrankia asymbiotica TaxID=1834516 RepID=UPI0018E9E82C
HTLHTHHTTHYLELTPHPTLTPPTLETLHTLHAADDTDGTGQHVLPLASPHQPAAHTVATVLATLWTHGRVPGPGPAAAGAGTGADLSARLPTYPFQHKRYWLHARPARETGDPGRLGLGSSAHALLGAAVPLAGDGGLVLTGRISVAEQPWLADHAIDGTTLLPAAAFLDLALHAARHAVDAGDDRDEPPGLESLALEAPLALGRRDAVQVQVVLGPPDGPRRTVAIHARPETPPGRPAASWTRHASGVVTTASGAGRAQVADLADWPPADGAEIDVTALYERLADEGYHYGPAFRGLASAWRHGEDLAGEVGLGAGDAAEPAGFGIHPALLDAALHLVHLDSHGRADAGQAGADPSHIRLPFAWSGVTLHATGTAVARVRLAATGADAYALTLADADGAPVLTVDELVIRSSARAALPRPAATDASSLLRLEWTAAPGARLGPAATPALLLTRQGGPLADALRPRAVHEDLPALIAALDDEAVPELVVADLAALAGPPGDPARETVGTFADDGPDEAPAAARAGAERVLGLLRNWLAEPRLGATRLVLVTHGAVGTDDDDPVPALPLAPVWGMVRTAQAEHPGRFALLDLDDQPGSLAALPAAFAQAATEPQLALRAGALLAPRLAYLPATSDDGRTRGGADGSPEPVLDPDGTVLITGGTGTLGGLVARHLVTRHGARHL